MNSSVGVCLIRSSRATARCSTPCAELQPLQRALAYTLVSEDGDEDARACAGRRTVSTAVTVTNPTRGSLTCWEIAHGEDLADRLVHPAHAVGGHPSASRSPHEASRRSTRTPCGKRASSALQIASAASPQRPAEPPASATASVDRCHESWWATSATEAPIRWRRCALTLFRPARLAFKESLSGKKRWTRRRTTNVSDTLRERALDLPRGVDLDHVPLLHVGVVLQHDAALEPRRDLAHVLLHPPQRVDLAVVDDRAVADEPSSARRA